MEKRVERITPAYRGVMYASTPLAVWWGRLEVTGLEHPPDPRAGEVNPVEAGPRQGP
jgi:hypothetical protein